METKTKHLPKGFLSTNGNPTINSVVMYFIYLSNLPENWDVKKIHSPSVEKVRGHFGVKEGFEAMIGWGILHGCCKSKTSSGRHDSMSRAYVLAQGLIGAGVELGKVPMIDVILKAA